MVLRNELLASESVSFLGEKNSPHPRQSATQHPTAPPNLYPLSIPGTTQYCLVAESVGALDGVLAVAGAGLAEGVPDDGAAAGAPVDGVEDEVVVGALGSSLEDFTGVAELAAGEAPAAEKAAVGAVGSGNAGGGNSHDGNDEVGEADHFE